MYRKLIILAAFLAFGIIVLGAYVRLNNAGLGCPDWPGCYGHIAVPDEPHEIARAEASFPGKIIEGRKGWIEMVHRYFASSLGLLIIAIAVIAWRRRDALGQSPALPIALIGVVIFQGLLGMWTVTLLLKPAVVTAHLLGGLALLALLTWLALRQGRVVGLHKESVSKGIIAPPSIRWMGGIAFAVLVAQIALGGWVSTNYAALACQDFPSCQGSWLPQMDFHNAFHVVRELGMTAQGELLSAEALTAIHWAHRLGAMIVVIVLGVLALQMLAKPATRSLGGLVLSVLTLQVLLGISNIYFGLPLALAVAHNAGAALLVVTLVVINFALRPVAAAAKQHATQPGRATAPI